MTLSPPTRTFLWTVAGVFAAVVIGNGVANESLALPVLVCSVLIGAILSKILPQSIIGLLLAGAVVGNIVGNRGFAQLYVSSSFPLLPAELVLLVGTCVLLFRSAFERRAPVRLDLLNIAILAWVVVSIGRLPLDLKTFGASALRDFAAVDYACLFFVAQEVCRSALDTRMIRRCLLWSCAALVVIFPVYLRFTDFFLDNLVFRGNPIIFYKGDLVGMFLGIGSVLFFHRFEKTGRRAWFVLSIIAAVEVLASENRASLVALVLAVVLLALSGRFRFGLSLGTMALLGLSALAVVLAIMGKTWKDTPIYTAYEEVASLADPAGTEYHAEAFSSMKGDNNAFRLTWWKLAFDEARLNSPWLGLGWGYDLAAEFERVYYPDGSDEFSARSPHNFFLTVFARGGILSFLGLLAILVAITAGTADAIRSGSETIVYWVVSWMILATASFGVVLEGPMGAMIFWTTLALARRDLSVADPDSAEDAPEAIPSNPSIQA